MTEDDKWVGHALLAVGIICILILSICIAWLIVLCERYRRKRKFRPGQYNGRNRSSGIVRTGASPQISRHLLVTKKPTENLVIANKAFLSKSTPQLFEGFDEIQPWEGLLLHKKNSPCGSEPLLPTSSTNYFEDHFEEQGLSIHQQIAAILNTFPNLSLSSKNEVTEENDDDGPETSVDDPLLSFLPSISHRVHHHHISPATFITSDTQSHSSSIKFMDYDPILPPIANPIPPDPIPPSIFLNIDDDNYSMHQQPAIAHHSRTPPKPSIPSEHSERYRGSGTLEFSASTSKVPVVVVPVDPESEESDDEIDDGDDDVFSTILETTL